MRILLTSILCHSGLMTHVLDLINFLKNREIYVGAAFKRVNFLRQDQEAKILEKLAGIPCCQYDDLEELKRFTAEHKFTLIHAHSHATFRSAAETAEHFKLPLIVTLHSVYAWNLAFGGPLRQANRIIAVGRAQAEAASRYQDKITIIENGIDLTRFVPDFNLLDQAPADGKINVLWYGRVDGPLARGIRKLDRSAAQLLPAVQIRALGSAGYPISNIPQLGWTDDPVPYLQKSHITLATSRALREAMACGSVGILIGKGYGGVITEEYFNQDYSVLDAFPQYRLPRVSIDQINNDLMQLIKGDLSELRRQARAIAEQYFDLNLMGEKILAIYQEIAG